MTWEFGEPQTNRTDGEADALPNRITPVGIPPKTYC
jgi:hypothetical protein